MDNDFDEACTYSQWKILENTFSYMGVYGPEFSWQATFVFVPRSSTDILVRDMVKINFASTVYR